MQIKNKFNNYLNEPQRINDGNFCQSYITLSEAYWNLADTDIIKSIDEAFKQVLTDKNMGKDVGIYNDCDNDEIKMYFETEKITLFKKIQSEVAKMIQDRIDSYLRKNRVYAIDCNLSIPGPNKHLLVEQYWVNYLMAKEALINLQMLLGNKLKK